MWIIDNNLTGLVSKMSHTISTDKGHYELHSIKGCYDYLCAETGLSSRNLELLHRIYIAALEGRAWRDAAIKALNDPDANELNWIDRIRYYRTERTIKIENEPLFPNEVKVRMSENEQQHNG